MRPIEKLKPKPVVPFTAERKEYYLEMFRNHPEFGGRKYLCAEAVGVSSSTIDYHVKLDPEFAEALEDARQAWIDENLFTSALKRARDGIEKAVIGGKFRDEIITYDRIYSDSLMALMLRGARPEYRDGKDGALAATGGGNGGVLIVPSAPATINEWQNQFGEMARGTTGRPKAEDPGQ